MPKKHMRKAPVVLLDQFPRNVFRGTREAFSSDSKTCEVAAKAIALGHDMKVSIMQASALYMCLLQQESLIPPIAAKGLFKDLEARAVSVEERTWAGLGVSGSERHIQQLVRFGRYPTRNAILGRTNTDIEEQFLKEHSSAL